MKILVVDDNHHIKELIKEVLKLDAYEVEMADDGVEGLEKYYNDVFDLVISDYLMPRMTGVEFFERIRQTNKTIKLMLMSGYLDQEIDNLDCIFIKKPFSIEKLLEIIKELKIG